MFYLFILFILHATKHAGLDLRPGGRAVRNHRGSPFSKRGNTRWPRTDRRQPSQRPAFTTAGCVQARDPPPHTHTPEEGSITNQRRPVEHGTHPKSTGSSTQSTTERELVMEQVQNGILSICDNDFSPSHHCCPDNHPRSTSAPTFKTEPTLDHLILLNFNQRRKTSERGNIFTANHIPLQTASGANFTEIRRQMSLFIISDLTYLWGRNRMKFSVEFILNYLIWNG